MILPANVPELLNELEYKIADDLEDQELDFKEWKEELNIEVRVYHTERNASFEDLKHFDAVKVKKYLDERVDK